MAINRRTKRKKKGDFKTMGYKSDIEIAQECTMQPITAIAEKAGIDDKYLEQYGKYKAKLSDELADRVKDNPDGKLILVTAINPTPAGEGKTTTSAGLGQAMAKIGKKAIIALREPSLGPVFGIKGGAAGGGVFTLFFAAKAIYPLTTPTMIGDFKACGGFLLIATGCRIAKMQDFPVADMIPAMVLVMPLSALWTNYIAPLL